MTSSTVLTRPQRRRSTKSTKPRKAPERALQVQIVKLLRKHCKNVWFAVPNGGFRHLYTATKLRAEGTRRGTPDLCFTLEGGRSAYLELKAEKGRLSPDQIIFRDHALKMGALWETADNFDDAYGVLAGWGCLPSEAKSA